MRRVAEAGGVLGILAMAVLLAACAGASTPAAPLRVVETTGEYRLIRHAFGETQTPRNPQRVLALGEEGMLADLLDSGIRPVAATVNVPDGVPLLDANELAGVELFPSAAEVSLETFSALRPDLIIGTSFFIEQAGYERLARIAPTVAVGDGGILDSYVETLAIFGQGDRAARDVAGFRADVQATGQRLDAANRALSAVSVYPGPSVGVWVDGPSPIPLLLRELGFTLRPDAAQQRGLAVRNGRAFIDLEQLPLLDGETLLLLQSTAVEGEAGAAAEVQANPLWARLPAVQAGRVVELDRLGYPGFRGQRALLAELAAALK